MLLLILLLIMPLPEQGGKVVLNAGIPDAEFFLDANFVAATDSRGTLTMENFPAGTFTYSIKKNGYRTYSGSFTIREGEDTTLSPVLEKISEPVPPAAQTQEEIRPTKSHTNKPPNDGRHASQDKPLSQSRLKSPAPTIPAESNIPAQSSADEQGDTLSIFVPAALLAIGLSAFGIWIWKMKSEKQIPAIDEPVEAEIQESPDDSPLRPAPEFIEELKRREELINAGFVQSKPRNPDPQSMKEKEVVIVLPKEAFRYEEDK